MLNELHIENIAVIERADISFTAGLNVLTGETGAGKSIVIDSIGAVLGGRVSRELVRHGAEKGLVTAAFDLKGTENWLREKRDRGRGRADFAAPYQQRWEKQLPGLRRASDGGPAQGACGSAGGYPRPE